ncbi:MAG: GNAT family N-acetyltransferase [Promethearchaeota archaeon]
MKYREAIKSDAFGITKVQVDTWKTAYQGIIAEEYLQSLSYKDKEQNWKHRLENPTHGAMIYVAETNNNDIIGFALATLEKYNPVIALLQAERFIGELCAIYVLNDFQNRNIGTELVKSVVKYFKENTIYSMLTWVLKKNSSRRFYEKLGGTILGEQSIEIGGRKYTEVAYGWENIKFILSHF